MLRKIKRNFGRWFLRPFWRHKRKVEWQPPTTIPRLDRRTRPPTLSEVVDNYYNGNGPPRILNPVLRNLEDWHGLLPAGGRHATHDVIALMVGTPSQLLTHFHDFITQQNPDTNSVALLLGGTVTPGDEEALYQRELAQPYWVRTSERLDNVGVYLDTLPTHRVLSRLIGTVASSGGHGGDQRIALRNLLTDSYTYQDIRMFIDEACRSYLDYTRDGCVLITVQGGGGSDPLHRCSVARLKAKLTVNRHIMLLLLPTDDEPLLIPNMKDMLAYELQREARELAAANAEEEQTPSTLHLLFQEKTIGPHDTDRALVAGLITLSGASQARISGAMDPTNKYRLIAKTAGTWLLVTPKVVQLPLVPMGRVRLGNGYRHEEHYQALLREPQGGQRIRPIISAINAMLAADPSAPHFITLASTLDPDEMQYIAEGVRNFPFQPGGKIHLFFNPCMPTVTPENDTAEALLCDFKGGSSVQACLTGFLSDKHGTALLNGLTPADRYALTGAVSKPTLTEKVEQEINRILLKDHP